MVGVYVRGDFHVCPNPLSFDTYNMCERNCTHCFIKTLEAGWLKNKTLNGLHPYNLDEVVKQIRFARSSKPTQNAAILGLRADLPIIVGRKCEPFGPSEKLHQATFKALKLFKDEGIKAVVETREVEGVFEAVTANNVAMVNLSIPFGDESVHRVLDPECPPYVKRFQLAQDLIDSGVKVGLITEPLIPTVNDDPEFFTSYADWAQDARVHHVNIGELKVSAPSIAYRQFQARGLDLLTIMKNNTFAQSAKLAFIELEKVKTPVSSPDWINFAERSACYGCCGLDEFGTHNFTFQYALKILKEHGRVSWEQIKSHNIFGDEFEEAFRKHWNANEKYYTLRDYVNIPISSRLGSDGNAIYYRRQTTDEAFFT